MFTPTRRLLVPAVAGLATLTLAGCTLFGAPAVPQAQPNATPSNLPSSNIPSSDLFGGNVTDESNNTTFSFGQGLPDDWPSDLPTPNGAEVAFAASETDQNEGTITYSATFALPANTDAEQTLSSLATAYKSAGWTISNETFGTFGLVAGGFDGAKGDSEVTVAYIGTPTETEGDVEHTLTISATYR